MPLLETTAASVELDQEDIAARLASDNLLGSVKVLVQRHGVTESDIETALATKTTGSWLGSVILVAMPSLSPDSSDAPGPFWRVRYPIQVIDFPVMRRATGGTALSAERIAQRVRTIMHEFATGRGQTFYFDGEEPANYGEPAKISYVVYFKRLGADYPQAKVNRVVIVDGSGAATLTCSHGQATIYYTLDGSAPCSKNTTAHVYSTPVVYGSASLLRAGAEITGWQASDYSQLSI